MREQQARSHGAVCRAFILALPDLKVHLQPGPLGTGLQLAPQMTVAKDIDPAAGSDGVMLYSPNIHRPTQGHGDQLMFMAMRLQGRVVVRIPGPNAHILSQWDVIHALVGIVQRQYQIHRLCRQASKEQGVSIAAIVHGARVGADRITRAVPGLGCHFQSAPQSPVQIHLEPQRMSLLQRGWLIEDRRIQFRRLSAARLHEGGRRGVATVGDHGVELPYRRHALEEHITGAAHKLRVTAPGAGAHAATVAGLVTPAAGEPGLVMTRRMTVDEHAAGGACGIPAFRHIGIRDGLAALADPGQAHINTGEPALGAGMHGAAAVDGDVAAGTGRCGVSAVLLDGQRLAMDGADLHAQAMLDGTGHRVPFARAQSADCALRLQTRVRAAGGAIRLRGWQLPVGVDVPVKAGDAVVARRGASQPVSQGAAPMFQCREYRYALGNTDGAMIQGHRAQAQ
ncbi:hypothetical protein ECTOBSL9_1379 [Ectothiorhodospira sp. BSL-9]|nr:hypothetical protein ECTOBSL9_1379 [Ectothiorhodospira sp. BSL-9]